MSRKLLAGQRDLALQFEHVVAVLLLHAQGIAINRLQTVSLGKERPVAICSDESCYGQNRRAVTVLANGPSS